MYNRERGCDAEMEAVRVPCRAARRLSIAPSTAECRGKVSDSGIHFVQWVNGGFVGGAT